MNYRGKIIGDINGLLNLFSSRCSDKTTLNELSQLASSPNNWTSAHKLFDRIRQKTLGSERKNDKSGLAQYLFEEICAKTLYNLSHSDAPFDPDSPYWIIPNALTLAKTIGIPDQEILAIIAKVA